jgi:hypothetical protein
MICFVPPCQAMVNQGMTCGSDPIGHGCRHAGQWFVEIPRTGYVWLCDQHRDAIVSDYWPDGERTIDFPEYAVRYVNPQFRTDGAFI